MFPVSSHPSKSIFSCYLKEQPCSCCTSQGLCFGASAASPAASCSPGQVPAASCAPHTSHLYATLLSQREKPTHLQPCLFGITFGQCHPGTALAPTSQHHPGGCPGSAWAAGLGLPRLRDCSRTDVSQQPWGWRAAPAPFYLLAQVIYLLDQLYAELVLSTSLGLQGRWGHGRMG